MYIVQPSWLAKIGVFPKGTKYAIYAKLDEPGSRFVPQVVPMSKWTVSPSRIDVETDVCGEDCGEKIAKVLDKLPETPLKAIGNNFTYEAPVSELDSLKEFACFDPAVPEGYEVWQRTFHVGLTKDDQMFNVQLSVTKEAMELSVNVHTELKDKEEAGYAARVARSFPKHREQAEFLITNVLKARVEHASSDNEEKVGSNGSHQK
jgi:hypothetical protein